MKFLLYSLLGIFIFSIFIIISIILIPFYLIFNFIKIIIWSIMSLFNKNTHTYHFSKPNFIYKTYTYSNVKKNNNPKYKVIDMKED